MTPEHEQALAAWLTEKLVAVCVALVHVSIAALLTWGVLLWDADSGGWMLAWGAVLSLLSDVIAQSRIITNRRAKGWMLKS